MTRPNTAVGCIGRTSREACCAGHVWIAASQTTPPYSVQSRRMKIHAMRPKPPSRGASPPLMHERNDIPCIHQLQHDSLIAAIPAHDMRILCDHGGRWVGEGFEPPVPSCAATFSIRHDRRSCCKQTHLVIAAQLPPYWRSPDVLRRGRRAKRTDHQAAIVTMGLAFWKP